MTFTTNSSIKRGHWIVTKGEDYLYELAHKYMDRGFAIISIEADMLPDDFPIDLIGDTVRLLDFCYPYDEIEPMFDIEGYDKPIPFSALDWAYSF